MKLILEPTDRIVTVNGARCRIWEGTTSRGVRVHAMIALVGVRDGQDTTEFERELAEQKPRVASTETSSIPLRLLLD